jgi:hypothetical protein
MVIPMGSRAASDVLFTALLLLKEHWPMGGWSWDSRLSCVSSSFSMVSELDARRALSSALRFRWTDRTIDTAPPAVQDLAEATGGVREGQELFATEEFDGSIAFALWWPWGDENTISVRAGVAGARISDEEPRLREVFGAHDY